GFSGRSRCPDRLRRTGGLAAHATTSHPAQAALRVFGIPAASAAFNTAANHAKRLAAPAADRSGGVGVDLPSRRSGSQPVAAAHFRLVEGGIGLAHPAASIARVRTRLRDA